MKNIKKISIFIAVGLLAIFIYDINKTKGDSNLPAYISWSTISPGSTPYAQASWFANGFKQQYNVILHNRYMSGDVAVLEQVFSHKSDYGMVGITGSYYAQEGLFEFARKNAGPKAIRLVLANTSSQFRTLLVRKDSNINGFSDLRGKRVAWIEKVPNINYFTLALLKYGGLSLNDVKLVKVEIPEYAIKALIDKKLDVIFSPSRERALYEAAKDNFPLRYLSIDGKFFDKKVDTAQFFTATTGKIGAGLNENSKITSATYAYPMLITLPETDAEYVENFTSALLKIAPSKTAYDASMIGWDIKELPINFIIPYHNGTVEVFKKMGLWTKKHEVHNQQLIKRQEILASAWKSYIETNTKPEDGFDFDWLEARSKALHDAGLEDGFLPISEIKYLYKIPSKQ